MVTVLLTTTTDQDWTMPTNLVLSQGEPVGKALFTSLLALENTSGEFALFEAYSFIWIMLGAGKKDSKSAFGEYWPAVREESGIQSTCLKG